MRIDGGNSSQLSQISISAILCKLTTYIGHAKDELNTMRMLV